MPANAGRNIFIFRSPMEVEKPIDLSTGSLIRMQARGFLLQQIYRRRRDSACPVPSRTEVHELLLREPRSRVIRAGRGASFTHPILVASPASVAGGISVGTTVRRGHDQHAIAVNVDVGRGRPAPCETHRIYSSHLGLRSTQRDGPTGLRAVPPAGLTAGERESSAPDDHFPASPHCRVATSC